MSDRILDVDELFACMNGLCGMMMQTEDLRASGRSFKDRLNATYDRLYEEVEQSFINEETHVISDEVYADMRSLYREIMAYAKMARPHLWGED